MSFELENVIRGIVGITILTLIGFILSKNKKKISWRLVIWGFSIQFLFAFAILKIGFIHDFFDIISKVFVKTLSFAEQGSVFLFGSTLVYDNSFGAVFAFKILPTIIFFSALTSVLFYFGILQKIIYGCAWLMKKTMKLSGAESLSAIGNIFLGQTESPLLVKPYIKNMTKSELMCLMSGGMSTIAGGVFVAFISFLGGESYEEQIKFAKHLLAASIMSAPAAIVMSKILIPETGKVNNSMEISNESLGVNVLESISKGTVQGIKLAVNVGAMLLVFISLISMINYILGLFSNDLNLQNILGYVMAPFAWIVGVCKTDITLVGQLIGEKTIINEFIAYDSLGKMIKEGQLSERSIIIATYLLCGFANFSSIGIQIGGIGSLAPSRISDLAKLGIYSLIAGTLACFCTATIVGMIL